MRNRWTILALVLAVLIAWADVHPASLLLVRDHIVNGATFLVQQVLPRGLVRFVVEIICYGLAFMAMGAGFRLMGRALGR